MRSSDPGRPSGIKVLDPCSTAADIADAVREQAEAQRPWQGPAPPEEPNVWGSDPSRGAGLPHTIEG